MEISYYDLLGMIKEGNIPEKVIYKEDTYIWKGKRYQKPDDGQFLSDMDENKMFDKCIEIPNDDFENIEEITSLIKPITQELKGELGGVVAIYNSSIYELKDKINSLIKNQKKIINILKEKK